MQGVHTALATPFDREGALDLAAFEKLCRHQVDAGVAGLVACGTTGEMPTLTKEEWEACIRKAVESADGRVPVTAGTGTNNTATTVANIERAGQLGASAALVVLPYYNKPNRAGLRAHVAAACAVGLPVVLYHVPGRTAQRLPVGQLAELCAIDGVAAVKEATGDVQYGQTLIDMCDIPVLSGDDFTFAALMVMGAHGVISVLSNVAPAMTVRWAEAAHIGDTRTLRELRSELLPVVHYLFSDTNPAPVKAALAELGFMSATVRLPLAPAEPPPPGLLADLQ